jgi:protein involved in polysaccharide export with SLBB domain
MRHRDSVSANAGLLSDAAAEAAMGDSMLRYMRNWALAASRSAMCALAAIFAVALLAASPALSQGDRAAAQPPPQNLPPQASVDSSYKLGSGDRVRITVFGHSDLSGEYLIDGAGVMAYPLIGSVQAGGLSAQQLQQTLTKRLQPDYLKNPNVSVEVLTYRPFYVVGEVKAPGGYAYVSGMTVLNAVALAGGFTYRAREDTFYITRSEGGGKVKIKVSVDTQVQPGDVITVRERYF